MIAIHSIPHLLAAKLKKNKFLMRNYFNIFKLNYIKMSLGTTSIAELPVSNSNGPPANVQLQTKETNEVVQNSANHLHEQREKDDAVQAQQNKTPPNPQD